MAGVQLPSARRGVAVHTQKHVVGGRRGGCCGPGGFTAKRRDTGGGRGVVVLGGPWFYELFMAVSPSASPSLDSFVVKTRCDS